MKVSQKSTHRLDIAATLFALLLIVGCVALDWGMLRLVFGFDLLLSLPVKIGVILGFQLLGIIPGLWIVRRRPVGPFPIAVRTLASVGICVCLLFGGYGSLRVLGVMDPFRDYRVTWKNVIESEELILSLDPSMKRLSFAAENLELPDFQSRQIFAERLQWNDLDTTALRKEESDALPAGLISADWPVATEILDGDLEGVSIWQPLFAQIEYFEHAKFYIVRGHFPTADRDAFETDVEFDGVARMLDGEWHSLKGLLKLVWSRGLSTDDWQVSRWELARLSTVQSDRVLFAEALDEALPDALDLRRARTSIHEQKVVDSLVDDQPPHPYFTREAMDRHPGVSVVDINDDGWDDLYVMARWGKNLFFWNHGDGTFSEVGEAVGLDIEDHTSSALFADFDNDGDKDVFLGRTLAPSMYLENIGNFFEDRSQAAYDGQLPSLVSSVSATDYDGDGLLDVYFSTYAANMLNRDSQAADEFLRDSDYQELQRMLESEVADEYLAMPGPPNVLLRNQGGAKFVDSASTVPRVFRNTYQSTWADFDRDGDQDVYLANDFAINNLLRNDGAGTFVDVAAETGTTDIGFGMGASWGDYDNDGNQDLYISNMYSKAGRRITSQFDFIDPRFQELARGNSLFRGTGGEFEKVSGLEEPDMVVEKAGWSWGGQFVDVNNDGYLDIHATNGYYTAPGYDGLPDI